VNSLISTLMKCGCVYMRYLPVDLCGELQISSLTHAACLTGNDALLCICGEMYDCSFVFVSDSHNNLKNSK